MAVWPVGLPQIPLVEGYGEQSPDNVIESPMDIGEKRRLRFTKANKPHTCAFEFDAAQLAIFKAFYYDTLLWGSMPFEFTQPTEGVTATFRFKAPHWKLAGIGGPIYHVTCNLMRED